MAKVAIKISVGKCPEKSRNCFSICIKRNICVKKLFFINVTFADCEEIIWLFSITNFY